MVIKVMELDIRNHLVFFLCIDYTIWPGWNHRGVYILSRQPELQVSPLPRSLSLSFYPVQASVVFLNELIITLSLSLSQRNEGLVNE